MSPLSLEDLPSPPPGKTGWPWTEVPPLPPIDGPLPRLTVVTPTLNQGRFLEEAIRSVLLQGYPDLEYVILDGGSHDGSVEIVERYAPFLSRWRSEVDGGQVAAIAEGFQGSQSDLLAWLNSDDVYLPGSLRYIGALAAKNPGAVILGAVQETNEQGAAERMVYQRGIEIDAFVRFWEARYSWHQPGLFVPRETFEASGGLDTSLSLVFDHDLVCRLLMRTPFRISDRPIACFRRHPAAKSSLQRYAFLAEMGRVAPRYWSSVRTEQRAGCRRGLALALARGAAGRFARGRIREGCATLFALGALARPRS